MTTYTIQTTQFTFDDNEDLVDAAPISYAVFTDEQTTGLTYSLISTDGTFNEIEINDDSGFQAQLVNGEALDPDAPTNDGLQTLTHSGGQVSSILVLSVTLNPFGDVAAIPILLDGAAIPMLDGAAEGQSFLDSITDESDQIPTGFEPDTFIPFTTIPGVSITEDDNVTGTDLDDSFLGGIGDDTLVGGQGADTLDGGKGKDSLVGGGGKDQLDGSFGSDELKGQKGKDTLNGGKKDDALGGGQGNDKLSGDKGDDTLTGGSGDDKFIFDSVFHGHDTITDFEDGADLIKLKALNIGFDDLTIKKTDGGMSTKIEYLDLQITLDDVVKSDVDAGDFLF